ncbi:MAG: HAD family hydrolase [Dehalococcoidia bacterium]|nr:HAD family hydrolase [Dehalococcoidia bacterium]
MIKAVFFDLHGTLTYFDPPRHEIHAAAAQKFGIDVTPEAIHQALPAADGMWRTSNRDNQTEPSMYEYILLKEAGIDVSRETATRVITEFFKFTSSFKLFDDVLPTVSKLKEQGLALGMITNNTKEIHKSCEMLGLTQYLGTAITSDEVGVGKPDLRIFNAALEQVKVKAEEAMHVGDQYNSDVEGARRAGIQPVLLDRNNNWEHINDCLKIKSLTEVLGLV